MSRELFAAGVRLVEDALEQDTQLAALLEARREAAEAEQQRHAAQQARWDWDRSQGLGLRVLGLKR